MINLSAENQLIESSPSDEDTYRLTSDGWKLAHRLRQIRSANLSRETFVEVALSAARSILLGDEAKNATR